jgi:protein O-mannosyl-transferase
MIPDVFSSTLASQSGQPERTRETTNEAALWKRPDFLGPALLLAVATFLVYVRASGFGFALLDDNVYVTNNAHVQAGLTWRSIAWAFSTLRDGAYFPLTWLSLMADHDLYGDHAGGFHVTNILLHVLNTVLLFYFLAKGTGRMGRSALVAGLFALHPLHVESVVWISERKDVLSIFFGLCALCTYLRYAARPGLANYLLTFALFICSLLAKQTLVTLPFVFLLLDYWPLRRFSQGGPAASVPAGFEPARPLPAETMSTGGSGRQLGLGRLLWEKVPFLSVSAGFCAVAVFAQAANHAVQNVAQMPLTVRLGNAAVAYVAYLEKTFFPHDLAIYYPHPGTHLGLGAVLASAALLGAISACAVWWRRRHPYFAVGWAWYLGTLVPMIGIVQVGAQQMADRYTYFSLIGILIAVVWTIASVLSPFMAASAARARLVNRAAVGLLLILAGMTCWQLSYWQDDVTLFAHDVAVTADAAFTRNKYGCALAASGKMQEAISQFNRALRVDPHAVDAEFNLGVAMTQLGDLDQAVNYYRGALAMDDGCAGAHNNLALIQNARGQYDEAKTHLRRALEINPEDSRARMNLGLVSFNSGDTAGAISNCQQALEQNPRLVDCYRILARALAAQGRVDEAIRRLRDGLSALPNNEALRTDLQHFQPGLGMNSGGAR